MAGNLHVNRQFGVRQHIVGAVVEQEHWLRCIDLRGAQQIGGFHALADELVRAADHPDLIIHQRGLVRQHGNAGILNGMTDWVAREHIVVAQRGEHAHRRTQTFEMRLHVFAVVHVGIVVHNVAGQQNHIDFFAVHDVGQFVELVPAHQYAQVQIRRHADTDGFGQWFADGDFGMPHHGRVGVINRYGKKRY